MTSGLLWLGPMRTSTAVVVVLFLTTAVHRRDWRHLVALVAWLVGFEWAWQESSRLNGWTWSSHALDLPWWFALGVIACAAFVVKVNRYFVAITAVVWGVWLLTGFHSNGDGVAWVDWRWEALNEAAKTAWGLAYLLPRVAGRDTGVLRRARVSDMLALHIRRVRRRGVLGSAWGTQRAGAVEAGSLQRT